MRKLKLDLAELTVTTFEMPNDQEQRGTVLGRLTDPVASQHNYTCFNTCAYGPGSCVDVMSCSVSACQGSCVTVCGGCEV